MELRGSRVLVTGATGGLGQAIARELRTRGAELVLSGRKAEVLEELAAEVDATTVAADLSRTEEVDRLVETAGRVDVLVANAGLPASGDLLDFSAEEVSRAIAVNLQAPILLARAVAPQMLERGRGHIVVMGSVAGITASGGTSIYNATKFGLRGFSWGFREQLRDSGVGVSIVEPGFVRDAGMFAIADTKLPRGVRTVTPEAVARGVAGAIERNKGEVVVAPFELRLGAAFGSVFPGLAATVQRLAGGRQVVDSLAEGQRHLR